MCGITFRVKDEPYEQRAPGRRGDVSDAFQEIFFGETARRAIEEHCAGTAAGQRQRDLAVLG